MILKKILLPLVIGIISLVISVPTAQAQGATGTFDNLTEAALKNLGGCEFMSPHVQSYVAPGTQASLEKTTIGECDPNLVVTNPNGSGFIKLNRGIIPVMGEQLAFVISTPPISSTEYIADVMHNFGVPGVQQAYAQTGIGFNALSPVLPIWKAFRNIAYLIYVIIFMVIGFMIMFRAKINPQTIVTIQTALPNLIVTLILITFSYAIAGFVIDLIYVGIYLGVYLLVWNNVFNDPALLIDRLLNHNLYMIMFKGQNFIVTAPAEALNQIVNNLFQGTLGEVAGWLTEAAGKLIIGILITIAMFKLFVTLGLGFINIILSVIIAPLHIMLNAFPGSQAFSTWLRGILAHAMMFPAVAMLFLIGAALMGPVHYTDPGRHNPEVENPWDVNTGVGYYDPDSGFESQWVPPFLMGRDGTIWGGEREQVDVVSPIMILIGLMIIIMAPSVAQMTRDSIKGEGLNFGSAMGQAVGSGAAMAWAPIRMAREHSKSKRAARDQAQMIGTAVHNPEAFR